MKSCAKLWTIFGVTCLLLTQPGCGRRHGESSQERASRRSKALAVVPAAAVGLAVAGPVGLLGGAALGYVTHAVSSDALYNRQLKHELRKLEKRVAGLDTLDQHEIKAMLADAKELKREFRDTHYRGRASKVVKQLKVVQAADRFDCAVA